MVLLTIWLSSSTLSPGYVVRLARLDLHNHLFTTRKDSVDRFGPTDRSIALVIAHFARIDRFVRAKRKLSTSTASTASLAQLWRSPA